MHARSCVFSFLCVFVFAVLLVVLLFVVCCLLSVGCWLLVAGCWLLFVVDDNDVVVDSLNHEEFAFT